MTTALPERTAAATLARLTLDEKVRLLEGNDSWHTHPIPRLGIRALTVTDGPHGVRRVRATGGAFDVGDNEPATAFPPAATLASTWDPALAQAMGAAIGAEAAALGVDVLLGPGVNIKRNPLCGRNFEYFSEDPLLSGVLGAAFVRGVQSTGVAATVKHLAANSNEDYRFVGDSVVDERALREIYLRQFERIVREARPASVMCAYNALNGTFCADDPALLTGILRDEWGFDGVVMTDWGATHDRVAGVRAGCELDMPGDNAHNRALVLAAVRSGRLPRETLDRAVLRMLTLLQRAEAVAGAPPHDAVAASALARRVATEGAVLLSNDGVLPLPPTAPVVVVGELFDRMRFQGAGSSLVTPTEVVTPRQAFAARGVPHRYARGYRGVGSLPDTALVREARELARDAGLVLFFGGLTDLEESEGFDRTTMRLPAAQTALLEQLLDGGARVVLVLFAGAPVELPFAERLAAVLDMVLPGQQGGEAVADLLFGDADPAGRLAESWPRTAADATSADDFDRGPIALYSESVYVGYRGHDAAGTPLRYPFGHGLSYTRFAYDGLSVEQRDGHVRVELTVRNAGDRDGVETVQVYVGRNGGAVFKPVKELRAFARVPVPAGGRVPVQLAFPLRDLAYWDVADHGWRLENGTYEVLVAASAADVRLRHPLVVDGGEPSRSPYPAAVDAAYATPPVGVPAAFADLLDRPLPRPRHSRVLTLETRLGDARRTFVGGLLHLTVTSRLRARYRRALRLPDSADRDARVKTAHFLLRMLPTMSLRSMAMASAGVLTHRTAAALADLAAAHPIRAVRRLLTRP